MFPLMTLRKFLMPGRSHAGTLCAAASLTAVKEKAVSDTNKGVEEVSKTESCEHCHASPKLRPSELPLYRSEQDRGARVEKVMEEPSGLEQMIGAVRKEVWAFYDQYKGYQLKVLEVVETGKAHSESALGFLREEATAVHRVGAIGLGGLGGLVMGLRGGWFRRIIYGTAGAAAMTVLCYPRESAEISDQSLQIAKYYITIMYNFIYGVKPDGLKFISTPSTVHTDKSSTKGSTPPVPHQVALPGEKEPPPVTPSTVPQVEEYSRIKQNPELYSSVSSSYSCPDPAIGSHKTVYPNNSDEFDTLGEMMSDVMYWGFRFVNMRSPCW